MIDYEVRDHLVMATTPKEPGHYVYICVDEICRSIYVGHTQRPAARVKQHTASRWWHLVCNVGWLQLPDHESMLTTERALIGILRPTRNRLGVIGR